MRLAISYTLCLAMLLASPKWGLLHSDTPRWPLHHESIQRVPITSANIKISANDFSPKKMTVFPGTTVRWTNMDRHKHTITAETGLFDSGEIAHDRTFTFTFSSPGTYRYFCAFEPKKLRGTIIVR